MKWGEISVLYMILHKTVSIVAYAIGRLKTVIAKYNRSM
jgi:hypothetical protein